MSHAAEASAPACGMAFSRPTDQTLLIRLSGSWRIHDGLPTVSEVVRQVESGPQVRSIRLDARDVTAWDTGLLAFLRNVIETCRQGGIEVDQQNLPDGVRRLLDLTFAVPERKGARREEKYESLLGRVGLTSIAWFDGSREIFAFIGESFQAFLKMLAGKARFRRVDLILTIQQVGADALPIVTLISVLVGMILAFVGAVQLAQFGAEIYVANLVGLGMAREMGAMMTAIIMAGRTGAAFAAQLGTMRVNQEIDALTTLGLRPMEFLVLPRMVALMLMMPLLVIYADALGILGGGIVSVSMHDITITQYFEQTRRAVDLTDIGIGLFKGSVFGALVALAGCLRGIQCGNSSAAVGQAATSAVVTGIVWIIASTAVMNVITTVLDI